MQLSNATTYYTVRGLSAESIFDHIESFGPTDGEGRRGSGLATARWAYIWEGEEQRGQCQIESMTVSLDLVVTLPRHEQESQLSPAVLSNWRNLVESVTVHEQTHVDIYIDGANLIKSRMSDLGSFDQCSDLEREIEQVWDNEQAVINASQDAFHVEEDARTARERAPLEAALQPNRQRLSLLANQVQAQEPLIVSLKLQITTTENQLASLLNQVTAIEKQYPGGAPSTIFVQYQALRSEYNEQVQSYNKLVESYNQAIEERQSISQEYERLLDQTNELVDLLNWTR